MSDRTGDPTMARSPETAGAGGGEPARGHRDASHTADHIVEAWGPDRATCMIEALLGLVASFAQVADTAATEPLPLEAPPGSAEDALVSMIEDVIYTVDVFGVVPVRFHLSETEDGGIAGDMEVVPAGHVELVGPVPKAVSYHQLSIAPTEGGWRCRVLIDV